MKPVERFLEKITSARFIFVNVVAIVFLVLSLRGDIPNERVVEIILLVFYAYFQRSDRPRPKRSTDP